MKVNIFGAGGFAKEVYYLAKKLKFEPQAFVVEKGGVTLYGIPVVSEYLYDKSLPAIVAIDSCNTHIRKNVVMKILEKNKDTYFPILIDPKANILNIQTVEIGRGSIVFAGASLTFDIKLGEFSHVNLYATIGHNVIAGDYFTASPSVNISGNNTIGHNVYFGASSVSIERKHITNDVIIGAGGIVVKDITKSGTYVGVPVGRIK